MAISLNLLPPRTRLSGRSWAGLTALLPPEAAEGNGLIVTDDNPGIRAADEQQRLMHFSFGTSNIASSIAWRTARCVGDRVNSQGEIDRRNLGRSLLKSIRCYD